VICYCNVNLSDVTYITLSVVFKIFMVYEVFYSERGQEHANTVVGSVCNGEQEEHEEIHY
jgi:hypothetical protein